LRHNTLLLANPSGKFLLQFPAPIFAVPVLQFCFKTKAGNFVSLTSSSGHVPSVFNAGLRKEIVR
jgi:hypothetical protein